MSTKKLSDKEKIEAILNEFQLNLAEFSRKLGVKYDNVCSVFFEKTKGFSPELMRKIIAAYPTISARWLLTSEGDMIASNGGIIQHHNGNATASQPQSAEVAKLIDVCASQQYTIRQLVNKLTN